MNQSLNFEEYNQNSDEFCDICFDKHDKTSITLKCGHKFHYDCILTSFLNKKIKNKLVRKCPYCRQDSGYLPLKDGTKPVKHIHKIKKKINKTKKCIAINKTGKRKGLSCLHCALNNSLYCGLHKNYINK